MGPALQQWSMMENTNILTGSAATSTRDRIQRSSSDLASLSCTLFWIKLLARFLKTNFCSLFLAARVRSSSKRMVYFVWSRLFISAVDSLPLGLRMVSANHLTLKYGLYLAFECREEPLNVHSVICYILSLGIVQLPSVLALLQMYCVKYIT